MEAPPRPTKGQLAEARGRTVPDVIAPGLSVVFVGINPSLYSAAVGHHFARPGNRFWKALHGAGFTERLISPLEDRALLDRGLGITNIVGRATAAADEVTRSELVAGAGLLQEKVARYSPQFVAVAGITAFRMAFARPRATLGLQPESMADSKLWVLPNPSGRTAAYQLPDLVATFGELKAACCGGPTRRVRKGGA